MGESCVSSFPQQPRNWNHSYQLCLDQLVGFPLNSTQLFQIAKMAELEVNSLASIKVRLEALEALVRRIVRHVELPSEEGEGEESDQLEFNVEVKEEQEIESSEDEEADMEAVFANDDDIDDDRFPEFEFQGNAEEPAREGGVKEDGLVEENVPASFANPFVSLKRLPPELVNVKEGADISNPLEAESDPKVPKKKKQSHYSLPNCFRRNGRIWQSCYFCSKPFRSGERMREHLTAKHTLERAYNCEECPKSFPSSDLLRSHVRVIHAEGRPEFKCSLCEESFTLERSLEGHVNRMHKDNRRECPVCKGIYKNYVSLYSHMKFQHGQGRPQGQCPICGVMLWMQSLDHHINLHKTNPNFKPRVKTKKQVNYNIPSSSTVIDPDRLLERPIVIRCNFPPCASTFSTEEKRAVHERRNHATGKQPCSICGKLLKNDTSLQNHLRKVHTTGRPFSCGICGQGFKVKTHMERHEKLHSKPGWKPRSVYKDKVWEKADAEAREEGKGIETDELSNQEEQVKGFEGDGDEEMQQ